ncbi:MAG: M55 family metallopeptidase [Anaerolineae bacterium]|nr:M55 family metallopeptidase [Anaerolineae bacterium]
MSGARVYVITDLEGVAGVQRWEETREEGPKKERAMRLLTAEVNAAVDGILDADPHAQVVVWDGHGSGGIDIERFHPKARIIPRGPIGPPYFMDEGFDALFFVGQHAMAGTSNAPLSHTYSSRTVEYYKLNGIPMGEFGCRAALAGSLGIPTVFVSGDDRAVAEARELVPDIFGAVVKEGRGIEMAVHLSPPLARQLIRETASAATGHIEDVSPFVLTPPYEQEIRFLRNVDLSAYTRRPGLERIDERTFVVRSDVLSELMV